MAMKFGLLLPHFGEFADRDLILEGAKLAESLDFDSVWVRDHLLFEPHGEFESAHRDFFEPLTVLTAVGAVTERITLGTATLIPYRHPLITAFTLASLTHMVGPRIIAGWGAGTFDHEFDAIGMGGIFRPELVESNARIFEKVFKEDNVDHITTTTTPSSDVSVYPKPTGDIPFWYGGATPASARRAAEYCRRMDARTDHPQDHREAGRQDGRDCRRERPSDANGGSRPTDDHRRDRGGSMGRHERRWAPRMGQ